MDLESIIRWRHDPAVGWEYIMFELKCHLGMLAGVLNTREPILAPNFTFLGMLNINI
jgi:hypothetical protein